MSNLQQLVKSTIGLESMYVLEKSGSAIHKEYNCVDVDLAKTLLNSLNDNYSKLEGSIKNEEFYTDSYLAHEFQTLFLAIDKLNDFLGTKLSEKEALEASIFQQHIRKQDKYIRDAIEQVN